MGLSIDRKKVIVIKGLETCYCPPASCDDCPYNSMEECNDMLCLDALQLLKEQEAVDKNTGEWKNGRCSCCGEDVASMLDTWTNVQNFLFCPKCGAKMEA